MRCGKEGGDDPAEAADQRQLQVEEAVLQALEAPLDLLEASLETLFDLVEPLVDLFEPLVDVASEIVDLRPEGIQPGVCRTGVHGLLHCCIVNISASAGVVRVNWIVRRHREPKATAGEVLPLSAGKWHRIHALCDQAASLLGYVMEGKVAEQVALDYASSPHDFKLMLSAGGQRASGIEQLESA